MNTLIKASSSSTLSMERLENILTELKIQLQGRVQEAYIFGSASDGSITSESDIDLILVKSRITSPFVQRAFEFIDLFEVFPKLDILVYTREELDLQLADSQLGFWKSVRLSMKRLI